MTSTKFSSSASAPLTFPAHVFAKLSPHPFLLENLNPTDPKIKPLRTNGRSPAQPRSLQVNVSSLTHASGSAVVRAGDTTVICGVRAEVLPITEIPNYRSTSTNQPAIDEIAAYDLLVPNIELATGSAPTFLPGVPPTSLAQTLSTRVYSLLLRSGLVRVQDLRIWHAKDKATDVDMKEGSDDGGSEMGEEAMGLKAYWALYIDLTFISYDGNPFDAAWAAVYAALRNTCLPRAWWDADKEMVLCSAEEKDKRPLNLRGMPMACSAAVFIEKDQADRRGGKYWVLVDPDRLEEKLCSEVISIVLDRSTGDTKILSLSKHGGTIVDRDLVRRFTEMAEKRWDEFRQAFK